jgi:L-ascorbate metabolism protein UlaG (beta-lactamase superfamily)
MPSRRSVELRLTHFGAAGWEISDGERVVLLDPYFSRVRYRGMPFPTAASPDVPGDSRPIFGPDDPPISDTAVIDAHITRADVIVISHSHFNHCMDMPYIARRTGALVVGTESTTNIARAGGVPDGQLVTVRGGEDYAFDGLSIKAVPSLHSALNDKRYFSSAVVPREVTAPLRLKDYVEGGTLAYLIRLGGSEILVFGSMNYIEREITGLRPSVALIPADRPRLHVHDYTGRLMRALGLPATVIATHWDRQALAYGMAQDPQLRQAESFVAEVTRVSPRTRVVVPKHFETVAVNGGAQRRARTRRRR